MRFIFALAAPVILTACATDHHLTPDRRLPWTTENLRVVGEKCDVVGITVDTRVIVLGGLFTPGQEPRFEKQEACLKRNIRLPADVVFMTD